MYGEIIIDEKMGEPLKEFWKKIRRVGKDMYVQEEGVIIETKDATELNERASSKELEWCIMRQKDGKAAELDEIPYKHYKNAGES